MCIRSVQSEASSLHNDVLRNVYGLFGDLNRISETVAEKKTVELEVKQLALNLTKSIDEVSGEVSRLVSGNLIC